MGTRAVMSHATHPAVARFGIFVCHPDTIICCAVSLLIAGRTVARETISPGYRNPAPRRHVLSKRIFLLDEAVLTQA